MDIAEVLYYDKSSLNSADHENPLHLVMCIMKHLEVPKFLRIFISNPEYRILFCNGITVDCEAQSINVHWFGDCRSRYIGFAAQSLP